MTSSAIISPCGIYRYVLYRSISGDHKVSKPCLFAMLNPSTADASTDDNTIRRCIGYAKRESCTSLTVINLFAMRATDPRELTAAMRMGRDPIGPENWKHFTGEIRAHRNACGLIIAGWGAQPIARTMPMHHRELRDAGALCLGMTAQGHPRHPLFVELIEPLVPWTSVPTPKAAKSS